MVYIRSNPGKTLDKSSTETYNSPDELAKYELFKYRLVTEMQRSDRQGSTFCIASMHVETPKIKGVLYPKNILDSHIIKAIKDTIRNLDIASMDDKKDYVILLNDTNEAGAVIVLKRILDRLPFLNNPEVSTKISSGISVYPQDSKTIDDLLQASKFAMFQAMQKENSTVITISSVRKGLSWEKEANTALSSSMKKFDKIIESTVKSLLSTFATKDEYLEMHSLQVAKIASYLSESVGLSQKYIREITLASLLHDIGMLEVPDEILQKKSMLTPEELAEIHKHPVIAVEKVLKPIKSLESILPIILDHHERWDGLGYPNRKRERNSHIGARIISISDAFHAMICDRPYRDAMDIDASLIALQEQANKMWEDKLINSFIDVISDRETLKKILDKRN